MIGPVVMTTVGDAFVEGAQIATIVWTGATTAGDTVALHHRGTPDALLWEGRTDSTQTYLGANVGPNGIHAPGGFYCKQISAGKLLIYLKEA